MNFIITVYNNDDLLKERRIKFVFNWHFKQKETEIFQNYAESGKLVKHTSNTATNVPMSMCRVFIIIHNIGTFDFFL